MVRGERGTFQDDREELWNGLSKAGIWMALVLVMVAFAGVGLCGTLDDPAAPTDSASAMYTIDNVYNRMNDGTSGTKRSGAFTEPSAGPASTSHTLTDLYDLASQRSRPAKTGQSPTVPLNPAPAGSDGALQKGVTWPTTRFTDNGNGTVKDNLTGLIWLKNANCAGTKTWDDALTWANGLASGSCSLTDSSTAGQWRLPNRYELESLLDMAFYDPALSNAAGTAKWLEGDAFSGVQSSYYWSSTTYANSTSYAWFVYFNGGLVYYYYNSLTLYVWPVRGGQ
jgi:hypothetical protein